MNSVHLDGQNLTAAKVSDIAHGAAVTIDPAGSDKIQRAWALLQTAIDERWPVYGVTTGLGPQVVAEMPQPELAAFALATLRGRAHALGPPMPDSWVRGALAVRLNTLLIGATSVRPAFAEHLRQCLNQQLTPVVGETASIGAADLLWGASCGLALCGEGRIRDARGQLHNAADALHAAGLAPLQPAPREGLALASHSGFSAAIAALGLHRCRQLLRHAVTATALSIEGFRANLSPVDPRVLALRPQPGTTEAAQLLHQQLAGSRLYNRHNARRLQDPLSIRNIVQVQGAAFAALQFATEALHGELNGVTDNPVSLPETREIISHGGYLAPLLGIALTTLCQALTGLAAQQLARISKLLNQRFSDLPTGLTRGATGRAGLAPLMKVAEALLIEMNQLAHAPAAAPSPSADSLEDGNSHAPLMAKSLVTINAKLQLLSAIEMLVATHAIRLRGCQDTLPPALLDLYRHIAAVSPALTEDRSLSAEIEQIAATHLQR